MTLNLLNNNKKKCCVMLKEKGIPTGLKSKNAP